MTKSLERSLGELQISMNRRQHYPAFSERMDIEPEQSSYQIVKINEI